MRLVIASNNRFKVKEIKTILAPWFDDVVSLRDAGVEIEVDEDGTTFEENALKKAVEVAKVVPGCAVLADDSGIAVDALDGAPGVYSARFSDPGATDERNNAKLLELMADVPDGERSCRFVSVVALVRPGVPNAVATGVCEGVVGRELVGDGGFGYDPLFVLPELGKTYAQITPEEKNAVSHRGRALRALHEMLESESGK